MGLRRRHPHRPARPETARVDCLRRSRRVRRGGDLRTSCVRGRYHRPILAVFVFSFMFGVMYTFVDRRASGPDPASMTRSRPGYPACSPRHARSLPRRPAHRPRARASDGPRTDRLVSPSPGSDPRSTAGSLRFIAFGVMIVIAVSGLSARLIYLQVTHVDQYTTQAQQNRTDAGRDPVDARPDLRPGR